MTLLLKSNSVTLTLSEMKGKGFNTRFFTEFTLSEKNVFRMTPRVRFYVVGHLNQRGAANWCWTGSAKPGFFRQKRNVGFDSQTPLDPFFAIELQKMPVGPPISRRNKK